MSTKLGTGKDLAEKMSLMPDQGGHYCSKKTDNLCKDCCCQVPFLSLSILFCDLGFFFDLGLPYIKLPACRH